MTRRFLAGWWRAFALLLLAAAPARGQPAGESDRQILVMVRQAPAHFRPDADYGGSYGDARARAIAEGRGRRIARRHGMILANEWPMPLLGVDCLVMTVPGDQPTATAVAHVGRDPEVAWSEPMHQYRTLQGAVPHNDPLFRAEPTARAWHLANLHGLATGRGVTVAVIDTRIDVRHPDLAGQVATSQDFVGNHPSGPEAHGTGVAGVIAAKADNGIGIVGVAPRARLMGLRACWQLDGAAGSVCDSISLARALDYAIGHRAQVINLSLGGPDDILLGKLIDIGRARGIAMVAAFDPARADGGFPASHAGVIAVADESLAPPPRGVYMAPGRDIPTTLPGGRWNLVNGSSYAAAQVSGLVALVRERGGGATFALVPARAGSHEIDAWASLLRASRPCDSACIRQAAADMVR